MDAMIELPWHPPVRAALAALRERGAHALMLHGPAGTGKLDLALSFARDLLCERPAAEGRACGVCSGCVMFAAGSHPDLRVLLPDAMAERRPGAGRGEVEEGADAEADDDAAAAGVGEARKARPSQELKIDQVRSLAGFAGVTTHRGGLRVVVLAPADALNPAAANALLKVLEEPPGGSVLLLVTDRIDQCLPTVRSRCALVRAPAPPRAQALAWLQAQGVADAGRKLVEAGGAPVGLQRDADDALDAELRLRLIAMLRRGARLAPAEVATEVPRTVAIGAAVALFQRWGWDYFAYRLAGQLRYHPQEAASFEQLAQTWSLSAAGHWIDGLLRLRAYADHPLNARSAVEGALLEYIRLVGGPAPQR